MSQFFLTLANHFKTIKIKPQFLALIVLIFLIGALPVYGQFGGFGGNGGGNSYGSCGTNASVTSGVISWTQTGGGWTAKISDGSYTATYERFSGLPPATSTSSYKYNGGSIVVRPSADCSTWYYQAEFTPEFGATCGRAIVRDTHSYGSCVVPTPVPTATPTPVPVFDLGIDSNNDGTIDPSSTGDDELAEDNNSRVGALVKLNEDDDNSDEFPDYDNDNITQEDDLKPIVIRSYATTGTATVLNIVQGPEKIRVWKDAHKAEEITTFPYTFPQSQQNPAATFTSTLYVEGVKWGASKIELYREGAKSAFHDEVRTFSSTQSIDLYTDTAMDYAANVTAVGYSPSVILGGLPQGASVNFEVVKNGSTIQNLNRIVDGNGILIEIDTSSSLQSPGDTYFVRATADEEHLQYETPVCKIVPGVPHTITHTKSKSSLIADSNDTIAVELTIKDEFGNLVEDDTPVSIHVLEEDTGGNKITDNDFSEIYSEESAPLIEKNTLDGKVTVTVSASELPNLTLVANTGSIEIEIPIALTEVTATLAAASPTLWIDQEQTSSVTLTTNATDGANISWSISNSGDPSQNIQTTTVNGGSSSITVSSKDAYIGDCHVIATVGGKVTYTKLEFKEDSPIQVKLDQWVLLGDQTTNSLIDVPLVDTVAKVAQYGVSTVTVEAKPNTSYQVQLNDESAEGLVELEGPDTDGFFVTDAVGKANFSVRSRGVMDPCKSEMKSVDFVVVEAIAPVTLRRPSYQQSSLNSPRRVGKASTLEYGPYARKGHLYRVGDAPTLVSRGKKVFLVAAKLHLTFSTLQWDALKGFFGFDTQTLVGTVASVVGGFFVVGDLGTIVNEFYKTAIGKQSSPDYLVITLAGIGVGADFGYIAGPVGIGTNAIVAPAIQLVKLLKNRPFTRAVVNLIKFGFKNRVLTKDKVFWIGFTKFCWNAWKDPGFRKVCLNALGDRTKVTKAIVLLRYFDVELIKQLITVGKASNFNPKLTHRYILVLFRLNGATLRQIGRAKNKKAILDRLYIIVSSLEDVSEFTGLLKHSSKFSKFDTSVDDVIRRVAILTKYSHEDDLVAALYRLRKSFDSKADNMEGYFKELEAACAIAAPKGKVVRLNEKDLKAGTKRSYNEIDVRVEGTGKVVEVKESYGAVNKLNTVAALRKEIDAVNRHMSKKGIILTDYVIAVPKGVKPKPELYKSAEAIEAEYKAMTPSRTIKIEIVSDFANLRLRNWD